MIKAIFKLISLLIFFSINSCCTFYNFQQPQSKEIHIKLEIVDSIVTEQEPNAILKVYLMNNSNTTISILSNFHRDWHPIVLFKDSIRYDLQSFIDFVVPSCSNYIEIEPSKEISFIFDFDISEYASKEMMFRGKNINYGNYKIELVYEDNFVKCCNAISGSIYSNKINLVYNKN